jgi:TRAP-type C4-dicarboxylate transport system permease small subunit
VEGDPVKLSVLTAALDWAMRIIMAAALLAMMILTFVDVLGRYAFKAPIFGASELISFLLAAMLFSGFAFVSGERSHITVTLFEGWLDRNIGRIRHWFVQAFCLAALALVAVELTRHALRMIRDRTATIVLDLAIWPLTLAMALMTGIGLVLLMLRARRGRHEGPAPSDDGAPP